MSPCPVRSRNTSSSRFRGAAPLTATPAAMRRPGKAGASLRERARRVLGVVSEHSKDIISMAQRLFEMNTGSTGGPVRVARSEPIRFCEEGVLSGINGLEEHSTS